MTNKPNIIYFVADQMRSDALNHHGCKASITPNLDSILNEGVSFENAYCQNPVCVPSRCSFLTGLYPHTTGHRTMHFLQNPDEPNILKEMKNNGYEVCWIGRNDVIPGDRSKRDLCDVFYDGVHDKDMKDEVIILNALKKPDVMPDYNAYGYYSHYIGKISEENAHKPGSDWSFIEKAIDYLNNRTSDQPFFLYLPLSFPHPPYMCEEPFYSSIDRSKIEPPRPSALDLDKPSMLKGIVKNQHIEDWLKENYVDLKATYLAMVSRVDYQYGMLVEALKKNNQYDNTSIFVFSDHGDYTGDYGIAEKVQNCFENTICNVPLLVKPAKQFTCQPRSSKALVELVDLSRTVYEMANIKPTYVPFGKSLLETLAGNEVHKDAVFCEGGRIHEETWAMELGATPASPYYPRLAVQYSEGPEHTKATMIRMGNLKYTKRLYEKDELYDLEKDPKELNNIIDDPDYKEQLLVLKERMLTHFMETGDIVPNRKDKR